jgi:hypothetical protein
MWRIEPSLSDFLRRCVLLPNEGLEDGLETYESRLLPTPSS